MERTCEELRLHLQRACDVQKVYYDKCHTPCTFDVGEWVLLSMKNLLMICPAPKLDHIYTGPFKIVTAWGKQSYKLQLPPSWCSIHPVFHISLLKPYNKCEGVPHNPEPEIVDGQEEYLVEEILHREKIDGSDHFLTKWFGWGPEHETWEPEEHVKDTDVFDEFLHNEKAEVTSRQPL